MSKGVNKVIVLGNIGKDPETRYTAAGTAITSLSVATSEAWKDKTTGEKQERTEWHRVKLFGKLAEIAGEYLKKGRQVYIEGSLRTDKYTDKDGVERYSTDIIASEMQMIGGSPSDSAGVKPSHAPRQERQVAQRDASYGDSANGGFDDDDIPFLPFRRKSYY